ncbi:unnamed protein product [Caenorhabditis bovis]|uniref:Uncharacterized protein n=1 Tax=Caenorhabditis bovis TaxID=2654633 RepID=A0A8S1EJR5_9PELO|nr:unnamed protein product [Caenorhabditis bovis]
MENSKLEKLSEPKSSLEEDEWLSKFKKNDIIQKQYFVEDTKYLTSYLANVRCLADSLTAIFISNGTYTKEKVPSLNSSLSTKSVWEDLGKSLADVEFLGSNKKDAKDIEKICQNIADVEYRWFKNAQTREKSHHSTIFKSAIEDRKTIDIMDKKIQKSLVENAQILLDLREQGIKYTSAIERLDSECLDMCKFQASLFNNIASHFRHLKEILPLFIVLAKNRRDAARGLEIEDDKK